MKEVGQITNLPGKTFKYSLDLSNNDIHSIEPDFIRGFKFVDLMKNPVCDNPDIYTMKNVRCDPQSNEEEDIDHTTTAYSSKANPTSMFNRPFEITYSNDTFKIVTDSLSIIIAVISMVSFWVITFIARRRLNNILRNLMNYLPIANDGNGGDEINQDMPMQVMQAQQQQQQQQRQQRQQRQRQRQQQQQQRRAANAAAVPVVPIAAPAQARGDQNPPPRPPPIQQLAPPANVAVLGVAPGPPAPPLPMPNAVNPNLPAALRAAQHPPANLLNQIPVVQLQRLPPAVEQFDGANDENQDGIGFRVRNRRRAARN